MRGEKEKIPPAFQKLVIHRTLRLRPPERAPRDPRQQELEVRDAPRSDR